jgi:Cft2 family RNA processing exonuclease
MDPSVWALAVAACRIILSGMAALTFQFEQGAIHLPEFKLWLDAHQAIGPDETVFVSHAHSDHIAAHARVLLSPPTQRLMRARIAGRREERILEVGRKYSAAELGLEPVSYAVTLLPAGHILGSAMSLLEAEGASLLYTGDFKLRRGFSSEACDLSGVSEIDILVMETTFGRARYEFPPAQEIMADLVRFCRETLDRGETPVLLAYSLGKAQEILSGLAGAGLPIMLSSPAAKLTAVYEAFGLVFPPYTELDLAAVAGQVVLAPPASALANLRQRGAGCRFAAVTGWAMDPACRYRYRADAAFPLSDHADFPDLVELVRRVAPRKVYTLHGFAADFAAHLRELGFDAKALSETDQLELKLGDRAVRRRPRRAEAGRQAGAPESQRGLAETNGSRPLAFRPASFSSSGPEALNSPPGVSNWFDPH